VGELGIIPTTAVDGVDFFVVSVVSYIGYMAVYFAREGRLSLL
jgi:hypothetical protein